MVSYLVKGDSRSEAFLRIIGEKELMISFVTLAELDRWAKEHSWGPTRRAHLAAFVEPFLVIWQGRHLCEIWAEVTTSARRNGHPIAFHDAWIAASAIAHDVPLLTNNVRDYVAVDGLRLAGG